MLDNIKLNDILEQVWMINNYTMSCNLNIFPCLCTMSNGEKSIYFIEEAEYNTKIEELGLSKDKLKDIVLTKSKDDWEFVYNNKTYVVRFDKGIIK